MQLLLERSKSRITWKHPALVTLIKAKLAREVHILELINFDLKNDQTGVFDDGNHGGQVKNRQIGTWS